MNNADNLSILKECTQGKNVSSAELQEKKARECFESIIGFCKQYRNEDGFFKLEQELRTKKIHWKKIQMICEIQKKEYS